MLNASPSGVPLGVAEVAAAVDACLDCLQACTSCADADLAEEDVAEMSICVALCLTCADACEITARVLSRPARGDIFVIERLLQACVRSCTSSAEECHRHAAHHLHCAICEQVCRTCVDVCTSLLDAGAFAEVG
jgi:hypothetical protein